MQFTKNIVQDSRNCLRRLENEMRSPQIDIKHIMFEIKNLHLIMDELEKGDDIFTEVITKIGSFKNEN